MKQGGLVTLKTAQYQCCPLMGFGTYYVITMEKNANFSQHVHRDASVS